MNHPKAYTAKPGRIADVAQALAYIPSGVEVRATNDLVIELAARDTATLVGSHQEKGVWAAVDTANPGCPVSAQFIPGYLQSLESQGFQVVDRSGSVVILHQLG
jgi:NAD-dependent oxidoreductase involved in siderophore biosynthesis